MSSMTSPAAKGRRCDGHSVGVIVVDDYGRILIGDRADGAGAAPIAGHVYDAHSGPRSAAAAEVAEEVGLTVTRLTYLTSGWRANRCRRGDGPDGPGHTWYLYRARAAGELQVDPDSYRNMRWAGPGELRTLAVRTLDYARGQVPPAEWAEAPGIEPVWVLWLHKADPDALPVGRQDLDAIEDTLATRPSNPAIDTTGGTS
ncbi:NUDIX domain-containing protein [Actinomadura sp. 3N407]|uniref:NUDIX domain-containing protein n=1 Tax=Actinomadura sp. 3N407 TaxID=3457423 RepID=UPI003FCE748B